MSPAFLVAITHVSLLTYLLTYCLRLANWTSPCQSGHVRGTGVYLHPGTICLTVSRTLILLCKPSNASLRLSSFLRILSHSARLRFLIKRAVLIHCYYSESWLMGLQTYLHSRSMYGRYTSWLFCISHPSADRRLGWSEWPMSAVTNLRTNRIGVE